MSAGVEPLRIMLVDDSRLFREGLAGLLAAAGLNVVAELADAQHLLDAVSAFQPDVVILDARMPPTFTDEGIEAAIRVRASYPAVGVLVLSTYGEGVWAQQLLANGSAKLGYLLKDRVDDIRALVEALQRISAGGTVVDPEVVDRLLSAKSRRSALDVLTDRERAVLALMAEGRSNNGIAQALTLSPRTVEVHIASVFSKLALDASDSSANKRVLSVLAYLQAHA